LKFRNFIETFHIVKMQLIKVITLLILKLQFQRIQQALN